MSLNRTQLFVINAITRERIADDLNDYLDGYSKPRLLSPDDDRLTDAICTEYAEAIGTIDPDLSEGDQDEQLAEAQHNALLSMGIMPDR